jgi:hypothetical protein
MSKPDKQFLVSLKELYDKKFDNYYFLKPDSGKRRKKISVGKTYIC